MAAHIDGNAAVTLDMTGLAQKGGAVLSHVRIGARKGALRHPRRRGPADLLLGCDLVTAAGEAALTRISPEHTFAVVNTHLMPTADFVLRGQTDFGDRALLARVAGTPTRCTRSTPPASPSASSATRSARNLFALGFAWQQGRVPVSLEALDAGHRTERRGRRHEPGRRSLGPRCSGPCRPSRAPARGDRAVTVDPVWTSMSMH